MENVLTEKKVLDMYYGEFGMCETIIHIWRIHHYVWKAVANFLRYKVSHQKINFKKGWNKTIGEAFLRHKLAVGYMTLV